MERQKDRSINKETAISIGLIITLVSIVGSSVWMFATLTANVSRNTERIDNIEVLLQRVATKEDLMLVEKNIKDYINK